MTEQEYERQFQIIFQSYKAGVITRAQAQELVDKLNEEFEKGN